MRRLLDLLMQTYYINCKQWLSVCSTAQFKVTENSLKPWIIWTSVTWRNASLHLFTQLKPTQCIWIPIRNSVKGRMQKWHAVSMWTYRYQYTNCLSFEGRNRSCCRRRLLVNQTIHPSIRVFQHLRLAALCWVSSFTSLSTQGSLK